MHRLATWRTRRARLACARRHTVVSPYFPPPLPFPPPRCGSSFTNTLYQYACRGGQSLYKFESVTDPHFADYQKDVCRICWEACGNKCEGGFTLWSPHDGLMRIREKFSRADGEIHLEKPFYEKYCAAEIIGHVPGHFPLKSLSQRKGTIAAMFRDPRRRLVSAFNHHRHAFGMNGAVSTQMRATTHTVEAYANFQGIQRCAAGGEAGGGTVEGEWRGRGTVTPGREGGRVELC